MIRIGLVGDIGSGKSYIANNFGYPVFNADIEVGKLYKKDKKIFNKLKKTLHKFFNSFPIDKNDVTNAIYCVWGVENEKKSSVNTFLTTAQLILGLDSIM